MAYHLEFSPDAERDFELIFEHLQRSYVDFGERLDSALNHARTRILETRTAANQILAAPHRSERHDDILPGLRHLSIGREIYWFDVEEESQAVRILAVFFGGQNHVRHMLRRLLQA